LAHTGVTSRRAADAMVGEGRVSVNGVTITALGHMIDETRDQVCVDGAPVAPVAQHTYVVLNKPAGYVTSLADPHHEKTVTTLLSDLPERVYPVGRLDLDTEGTLLFTNDGELAHRLTHPKFGIPRVYRVQVVGEVSPTDLARFGKGIRLPDGNVGRASATLERTEGGNAVLLLELTEGRKREVKHLCSAVGHPVVKLERISFAGITCEGLLLGQWRQLSGEEVAGLRRLVDL
jgi:23S rRNA pseudouridine2605 synthase